MPVTCHHVGCTKYPLYGVAGSKTVEFCSEHMKDGMVDVKSKRCAHHGCTKQPNYGVAGSKKPEYCSQHRKDGMVDVKSKRCAHHGCTKYPLYGVAGSTKPEYCSDHRKDGMVDVKNRRCAHHGCTKYAHYGVAGSTKPEYCSEHRKDGMVNVKNKRCVHHGCTKYPVYGVAGSRNREFCSKHATKGMVNLNTFNSQSSGDAGGGDGGRGRGGGSAARDGGTIYQAGADRKRSNPSPAPANMENFPGSSREGTKRPRQTHAAIPAASTAVELAGDEGDTPAGHDSFSEPGKAAKVKTEKRLFEGRPRGSFQRRRRRSKRRPDGEDERATPATEDGLSPELAASVEPNAGHRLSMVHSCLPLLYSTGGR